MKYLPFESHIFETQLSQGEVCQFIMNAVNKETEKVFSIFGKDKFQTPYKGNVDIKSFKIYKNSQGRNSFRPIILGKIENGKVTIKLRMVIPVLIFMTLWLSAAFSALVSYLIQNPSEIITYTVVPLFFLAGYSLMMYGFKSESKKILKFFRQNINQQGVQFWMVNLY